MQLARSLMMSSVTQLRTWRVEACIMPGLLLLFELYWPGLGRMLTWAMYEVHTQHVAAPMVHRW